MRLVAVICFSLAIYLACSEKYYKEPKQFKLEPDYRNFLDEHNSTKQRDSRYQNVTFIKEAQDNFHRLKEDIDAHHASYLLNLTTFDRKLMRWSDFSKREKFKNLCGARLPKRARAPSNAALLRILKAMPKVPPGTQVNHCQFPNPIQDQQSCGCCWAFSCAQVVEHQLMMKKGLHSQLSVQQLIDCDTSNDACEGGWPSNGFRHIEMYGLASSADYTYQEKKLPVCKRSIYRKLMRPHFINQQLEVELKGDEESMKKLILRIGAAVVSMHADEAFLSMSKGFYQNDSCPKKDPNHAMVVCGFGSDASGEYWLIRNSWGSGWGEYGYVRMKMGNTCGVASFVMWPVIDGVPSLNPFGTEPEEKLYENVQTDDFPSA